IRSIRLTKTGDVVAGGQLGNADSGDFFVEKLDGNDGHELWSRDLYGGVAEAIAIDPDDDVFAAGALANAAVILKFSGVGGDELWRASGDIPRVSDFTGINFGLLATDDGDALIGGSSSVGGGLSVAKLSGASGGVLWRFEPGSLGRIAGVALTPAGDVIAAGSQDSTLWYESKLNGSTGDLLWEAQVERAGTATAVAVDAAGDV